MMEISILDVPIMILLGILVAYAYKHGLRQRNKDYHILLGILFVAIFWINSLLVHWGYLAEPWGIGLATAEVAPWLAFFYILAYPMWYTWGQARMFTLIGRKPEEGGIVWFFGTGKDEESYEIPWDHEKKEEKIYDPE